MAERAPGFAVLFTGLPAAGKSTLAAAVRDALSVEHLFRPVILLDGDASRRTLSADLGFTRADREEHVRRVAACAADIARTGGIALCSLIAPYDAARKDARRLVERHATFVLLHVSTPLDACEARDPKGLYASARAGRLPHFTGVSDPYEPPEDAELAIDTRTRTPTESAAVVVDYLRARGVI